jgi:hypothetical protein
MNLKLDFVNNKEDNCEIFIDGMEILKYKLEEKNNVLGEVFKSDLLCFHESNHDTSLIGQLNTTSNTDSMLIKIRISFSHLRH